jgi:hypothetical protein
MAGPFGTDTVNADSTVVGQAAPADLSLGNASFNASFVTANGRGSAYNPRQNGVFGLNPLMSPKYSLFRPRDAEYKDTLARLYISLPTSGNPAVDASIRQEYLQSLPADQATQALAQVLLTGPGGGSGFIDFFLAQANEAFQEIVQIDKVLGDDYVAFFYGEQPPQFQYAGTLLNSMQDDQRSGFARAYQHILRGTQLARRGALARLRYDNVIVSGTMLSSQQTLNADNELAVPFSFTFLVKEYVVLSSLPFTRKTKEDYVKLATDSAIKALRPIRLASDVRVRTAVVVPPIPAAVSAAGSDAPVTPTNTTQGPMVQLMSRADDPAELKNLSLALANPNIRGTIDPVAPVPPASFVGSGFPTGSTP